MVSFKAIFALIAAIGATAFVASGGIDKTKSFVKSTTAGLGSGTITTLQSEKAAKTEEMEEKITSGLTPRSESRLPSSADKSSLAPYETNRNLPAGLGTLNEQETIGLTPAQQKAARLARELVIPQEIKYSTSLAGAALVTGPQLKREEPVVITNAAQVTNAGSSALQQAIVREQQRAEQISLALYGNVQNPKFVTTEKPVTTTQIVATKVAAPAPVQPTALQKNLAIGNTSAAAKELLAQIQASKK